MNVKSAPQRKTARVSKGTVVRGISCHDCVVTVLLGAPPAVVWDADERRAVDALAEAGMVPRLRMVEEPALRTA